MSELKYFNGITDEKIAYSTFRRLSKELHPDRGGNNDEFHKLKKEYDDWKVLKEYGKLDEKPPKPPKTEKPPKPPKPKQKKAEKPPEIAVQEPQTDIVDDLHKVVDGLAGIMNLFSKI